jgi:hypothetical protein
MRASDGYRVIYRKDVKSARPDIHHVCMHCAADPQAWRLRPYGLMKWDEARQLRRKWKVSNSTRSAVTQRHGSNREHGMPTRVTSVTSGGLPSLGKRT